MGCWFQIRIGKMLLPKESVKRMCTHLRKIKSSTSIYTVCIKVLIQIKYIFVVINTCISFPDACMHYLSAVALYISILLCSVCVLRMRGGTAPGSAAAPCALDPASACRPDRRPGTTAAMRLSCCTAVARSRLHRSV